ncbi:MAG: glycosyltransferase family 2 protein [Ginsengibacter sp.]
MDDKISIITVTYNAAATLEDTILSIIKQTYPNYEYIIVDGGSTDNTLEIIKKYQHKLAHWVSEKDSGIYEAMNKGIKASNGKWLIFLGADDVLYTNEVLNDIFLNNETDSIDFLYGDVIMKSKGTVFGGKWSYYKLVNRNINHQCIFYNRTIFEEQGFYNTKYKILADYEFNLRIFRKPYFKKKYIPQVVSVYNNRGISNQVLDEDFYVDQLEYFINTEKLSPGDYRLQTYFFFYGFTQLLKHKRATGFKNILHAIIFGRRKFFYCFFCVKYFFSLLGFGKKIRSSFVLKGQSN